MPSPRRDIEWADGIRGIASFFIVTSHCCRGFLPNYLSPADDENGTPHLFQRPFLRLIAAGPFWTSIFFILSGYVCAIKPIRLCNTNQPDEARRVIASSAFRRSLRIGVPATLCTMMSFVIAQMGLFDLATRDLPYDSEWLPRTTPHRMPGITAPLRNLFVQCFNTWAVGFNEYEGNQWTLTWEMQGALLVFLAIMITAAQTIFWRRTILVLTTIYYFYSGQFISIFCFFSGALLADLSLSLRASTSPGNTPPPTYEAEQPPVWLQYVKEYWPIATAILALLLASVPPQDQHYVFYSRVIYYFFEQHVTPTDGYTDRVIAAFGGVLMILSILYSSQLRHFFSLRPFLFLGNLSFPLYLLHGTFIRLVLQWTLLRFLPQHIPGIVRYYKDWYDDDVVNLDCSTLTPKLVVGITYIIWWILLFLACRIWKRYVDVLGVTFSRFAEETVLGKRKMEWEMSFDIPRFSGNWQSLRISVAGSNGHGHRRMDTEKVALS